MTNIFNDDTTKMPSVPQQDVVVVSMSSAETPIGTGPLSGEHKWPQRNVANLEPRRRGHCY